MVLRPRGRALRFTDIFADDMTIIVAGQIEVQPGQRQRVPDGSQMAMRLARETTGCEDFVVAADPLEEHRVNVFEVWRSRTALHARLLSACLPQQPAFGCLYA